MSGTQWTSLRGEHSRYRYSWVTEPPLVVLSKEQVLLVKEQMRQAVLAFDTEGEHNEDAWNDRLRNTASIIDITRGSDHNLGYRVLGVTVGLICMSDYDPTYIDDLVTHPGVADAGGILMEAAADYSQSKGHGGKIELYSYDGNSTGAYLAMGFVKADGKLDSGGTMTLDPSTSGKWMRVSGHWRLAKYATMNFYNAGLIPPPMPPKPRN